MNDKAVLASLYSRLSDLRSKERQGLNVADQIHQTLAEIESLEQHNSQNPQSNSTEPTYINFDVGGNVIGSATGSGATVNAEVIANEYTHNEYNSHTDVYHQHQHTSTSAPASRSKVYVYDGSDITGVSRGIAEANAMYDQIANDPVLNRASQALAWWFARVAFLTLFMSVPVCMTVWLRVLMDKQVILFHRKRIRAMVGGWVVLWLTFSLMNDSPMMRDGSTPSSINFSIVMFVVCVTSWGMGFVQEWITRHNAKSGFPVRAVGNGFTWAVLLTKNPAIRQTLIQDIVIGVGLLLLLVLPGLTRGLTEAYAMSVVFLGVVLGLIFGYLWIYQRKFAALQGQNLSLSTSKTV